MILILFLKKYLKTPLEEFTSDLYNQQITQSSRFEAEEEPSLLSLPNSQPRMSENTEPLQTLPGSAERPQNNTGRSRLFTENLPHSAKPDAYPDAKRRKLNTEAPENASQTNTIQLSQTNTIQLSQTNTIQLSFEASKIQEPSTAPAEVSSGTHSTENHPTQISAENSDPQCINTVGFNCLTESLKAKVEKQKLKRVIQEPTALGPRTIFEFE